MTENVYKKTMHIKKAPSPCPVETVAYYDQILIYACILHKCTLNFKSNIVQMDFFPANMLSNEKCRRYLNTVKLEYFAAIKFCDFCLIYFVTLISQFLGILGLLIIGY